MTLSVIVTYDDEQQTYVVKLTDGKGRALVLGSYQDSETAKTVSTYRNWKECYFCPDCNGKSRDDDENDCTLCMNEGFMP